MAVKKTGLPDYGVARLKRDVSSGGVTSLYVFWGEEAYLREHYLGELVRALADGDESSVRVLVGKACTPQALSDAVLSCPFLSRRTLVIVRDVDVLSPDAALAAVLPGILGSLPAETCLVFVCGEAEPGGGKPNKKILDAVLDRGKTVCFNRPSPADMGRWVRRRFAALGKDCPPAESERLASLCGGLMYAAIPEIEKVAAYCAGPAVTRADVDAVVAPVPEAVIFDLTDAVAARDVRRAEALLDVLARQKLRREEAVAQLGAAMRRLYAARLTLDSGRSKQDYMVAFGVRSPYAADIHLRQACAFSAARLRRAAALCAREEQRGFYGRLNDRVELDALLFELCGDGRG